MEKINNLNDLESLSHSKRVGIIEQEIVRVCMNSGFRCRENVIKGYNYALLKVVEMLLSESCHVLYKIRENEIFEDVDLAYALNDKHFDDVTVINFNSVVSHIEFVELVYILSARIKAHNRNYLRLVDITASGNVTMFVSAKLRRAWFKDRNINIAKEMLVSQPSNLLSSFNKLGLRHIDLDESLHGKFDDPAYLTKEDLTATFLREFYRFKLAGWTPVCS